MGENTLAKRFTAFSLLRFAFPNIIMMMFLSTYTVVDGMFVSRLVGTLALSSLNMSWPLLSVELALAIMLATGGSAVIARKQGEGKAQEAREDFTFFLCAGAVTGAVYAAVSLLFLEPILVLLGTSAAQMPDCIEYTRISLYFAPAMFLQTLFQTYFVTAGKPTLGLGVTVSGGIGNVIMDYVLMGPANIGVGGAAIATGISYMIPAVFGLLYFWRVRTGSLYLVKFPARWRMLRQACGNGASEMVTNVANAVTTFLFNILFMRYWQEDGVASITMILYFQFVFGAAFFGFSMGVSPVISYKYGANDTEQLKHIIKVCVRFVLACALGIYLYSLLSIRTLLTIFTETGSPAFQITLDGFPYFAPAFLLMGLSVFASAMFTALSNGVVSAIISFGRTFIFLVGMLLLLPELLGQIGIWLAVPVAEAMGLVVSVLCLLWGRKRYHY